MHALVMQGDRVEAASVLIGGVGRDARRVAAHIAARARRIG